MPDPKDTLVSAEGLAKMEAELAQLINERRPQIAARIKAARELGDLKENADYHDAKNEQSMVETKILQLDQRVRTALVVEATDSSTVAVGTSATVECEGDTEVWNLVGPAEADPGANKVSYESPIGSALMGTKVGDTVTATLPFGEMVMVVKSISVT